MPGTAQEACSISTPCGNSLRMVLESVDFKLYECLNGHSYRVGAPPPKPRYFREKPKDPMTAAIRALKRGAKWARVCCKNGRCGRCAKYRRH